MLIPPPDGESMNAKRTNSNNWPARLRALRWRLRLTQRQAAERAHISQSQWSAFEAGRRQPTRTIAYLLELMEQGGV